MNTFIRTKLEGFTTLAQVLEFGTMVALHGGYSAESIAQVLGVALVMIRKRPKRAYRLRTAIVACCDAYHAHESDQSVRTKLEEIRQWLADHP